MSQTVSEGDLLSVQQGIIVHGCNAQGVMGSGVAAAVRSAYPGAYEAYRALYEKQGNRLKVGQIAWYTVSRDEPKLAIANAITQEYYGRDPHRVYVDYAGIRTVFEKIGALARQHGLPVHYPLIGAGLANGDWSIIEPIIHQALEGVEHTLWTPTPAMLQAMGVKPAASRRSGPR